MTTIRALLFFALLDAALPLLGFDRVYRLVVTRPKRRRRRLDQARQREIVHHTYRSVRTATRYYFRRRKDCLPKALTTFYLLQRRGVEVSFCLGVRKYPFGAHSWVEWQGRVIDDHPAEVKRYTLLSRA